MSKNISEFIIMDGIRYAKDHEWAKKEGDIFIVGISDYAQDQLGDIVFVELPELDSELKKEEAFGSVESTKAVSELYMPLGGKVIEINDNLADKPELVNKEPYEGGWMIKIQPDNPEEFNDLMDKDAYTDMLKGL